MVQSEERTAEVCKRAFVQRHYEASTTVPQHLLLAFQLPCLQREEQIHKESTSSTKVPPPSECRASQTQQCVIIKCIRRRAALRTAWRPHTTINQPLNKTWLTLNELIYLTDFQILHGFTACREGVQSWLKCYLRLSEVTSWAHSQKKAEL